MKPSRACQKLISGSMHIISIAHKKKLTLFTILGSLAAGNETLQSMSKADFEVHARHKHRSPQKNGIEGCKM